MIKKFKFMILAIIAMGVISCSGSGSSSGDDNPTDKETSASPVITPDSDDISVNTKIEITHSQNSNDVDIYYTTDGTNPGTGSFKYSNPFTLSEGEYYIKAVAKETGKEFSSIVGRRYTVTKESIIPVITATPSANTYTETQYVKLKSSNSDDDIIYYTINGSDPDENSLKFVESIEISTSLTIKAYGKTIDGKTGSIYEFKYVIDPGSISAPVISPSAAEITVNDYVSISTSTGTIKYTIDDEDISKNEGDTYSAPFKLPEGSHTVRAIAIEGDKVSTITKKDYVVNPVINDKVKTPVISTTGSMPYYSSTEFTISCETTGAEISYKIDNGTYQDYTSKFSLSEGTHTIYAMAVKSGMVDSNVAVLAVEIISSETGIRIYYKSENNIPTIWTWQSGGSGITDKMTDENGNLYVWDTQPQMIAHDLYTGWYYHDIPESFGPFNYTIVMKFNKGGEVNLDPSENKFWYDGIKWYENCPDELQVPAISVDVDPGTYKNSQTVSLTSTNKDDEIYFTIEGSDPYKTPSLKYTNPITVNKSMVIKAIGINREGVQCDICSFSYIIDPDLDDVKPTITASMNPGNYENPVTVNFTVWDNNSATTKAYYTEDGTSASQSSDIYIQGDMSGSGKTGKSFTVNMDETKVFSFFVVDNAGNKAEVSFRYRVGEITVEHRDFREETVYFLMTARFYDGDPSNNRESRCYESSGNDKNNDPAWRGDFKGLIEKLDYIKALGFTAVWITPPVLNRSDYDYHGYHAWDMTKIDKRLESSDATYQDLIDEIHKRGMKVIQDIVLNHSSRFGEKNLGARPLYGKEGLLVGDSTSYYDKYNPNFVYDGASYEPISGKSFYNGDVWQEEAPDLSYAEYDKYMEIYDTVRNNPDISGPYDTGYDIGLWGTIMNGNTYQFQWSQDAYRIMNPKYYHVINLGNWEDYDCQMGSIHPDCVDLNTESKDVQDYLIDTYSKYIEMGVDGFRVDTVKHISRVMFNRHFNDGFIQAAKNSGNDYFYLFGEVCVRDHGVWNKNVPPLSVPFYTWKERKEYSADDELAAMEGFVYEYKTMGSENQPVSGNHLLSGNNYSGTDYSQFSGLNVIDFRLHWNFEDVYKGWSIHEDDKYTNDATWNLTYIESHDYSTCEAGSNLYNRENRGELAMAERWNLMWTWRGIPCILYGNEIYFKSGEIIDEGPNRPLEDTGRAYFGDHLEGSVSVSDFGVYSNPSGKMATTLSHPLAQHIRKLNMMRHKIPALQKGQYSTEGCSGNIAFKKRFTKGTVDSFCLVTINDEATFSGIPNGKYVDAVSGDEKNVTGGTLSVSAPGKGNMRIYVLDLPNNAAPGKVGESGTYLK